MSLKVKIVTGHGDAVASAPQKGWERWGLNATWQSSRRPVDDTFDRWFELHRKSYLDFEWGGHDYNGQRALIQGARKLPIYVQDVTDWPAGLTIKAFPFKKVQALAPAFGYYHACSIDWMIAYAILEGAKAISLCGVEQENTREPYGSRACVEFWCGFATARGIAVTSDDGSCFKMAHLCYTKTPYAVDPTWMLFEDRSNGGNNRIGRARAALAKSVDGKVLPTGESFD